MSPKILGKRIIFAIFVHHLEEASSRKTSNRRKTHMKIGILTFHAAHNYGAILQCLALQKVLQSQGHDVEIIDYRPRYLTLIYKKFHLRRFFRKNILKIPKIWIRECRLLRSRCRRYNAFQRFIDTHLHLSSTVVKQDIPSDYDIYIMGSDQIWNPNITEGFDPVFFGDFNFPKGRRKYISYAASMEAKALTSEAENYYRKALGRFDAISVREERLARLLQPLTPQSVNVVLDPTLLLPADEWNRVAQRPHIQGNYVLIYQTRKNPNTMRIARQIAAETNARVIEVAAYVDHHFHPDKLQCESPAEFVGWVAGATCVVTTSFHGTAFSVIFNRPFYCLELADGEDTRSQSLCEQLGLQERMIRPDDALTFTEPDYTEANARIAQLRKHSLDFLKTAIHHSKNVSTSNDTP